MELHLSDYRDERQEWQGIGGSFRVVEREVHREARLLALAQSDELTGLPNRRNLLERLAQRCGPAATEGAHHNQVAVLFAM